MYKTRADDACRFRLPREAAGNWNCGPVHTMVRGGLPGQGKSRQTLVCIQQSLMAAPVRNTLQ